MKLSHTGIRVKDIEASVRFYTEVLGMKLLSRTKIATTKGEVAALQSPGSEQVLELNYYGESSPFATPYTAGESLDHLAFKVDCVNEAFEALRSKGVEVAFEPFDEIDTQGRSAPLAFVQDPNGIWIELYQ